MLHLMFGPKIPYFVSYFRTQHYLTSPFYYQKISVQAGKIKLTEVGSLFLLQCFYLSRC